MSEEIAIQKYTNKIQTTVSNGYESLLLAVGFKLELFEHLGDEKQPRTSEAIAKLAHMKERYVREWLNGMVVSEFIECDPSGRTYWLTSAAKTALASRSANIDLTMSIALPVLALIFDKLCECFKMDGPLGLQYSDCGGMHQTIQRSTDPICKATLIPHFIPSIPNLEAQLDEGITCLEIGCAAGTPSLLFAERFPNSRFYGVDIAEDEIKLANDRVKEKSLSNVHFLVGDANHLASEWTEKFSYVMVFHALHDFPRPDLALLEIKRVLKPGGRFSMNEVYGTSNAIEDKADVGASMLYTTSLFHCVPITSYYQDSFRLGLMWGRKRAEQLLNKAGFAEVKEVEQPWEEGKFQMHFLCTK